MLRKDSGGFDGRASQGSGQLGQVLGSSSEPHFSAFLLLFQGLDPSSCVFFHKVVWFRIAMVVAKVSHHPNGNGAYVTLFCGPTLLEPE